jgi:AcrR family transcriptional regulator
MTEDTKIKELIIERAADMFFKFGFANTTMDQIAKDLNVSKKTLYKFFVSKEKLLNEIMQRENLKMEWEFQRVVNDPSLDNFHKVIGIAEAAVVINSKYSPQFLRDSDKLDCASFEGHQQLHDLLLEYIDNLLKEGIRTGIYREDISRPMVLFIVSCLQGNLTFEMLTKLGLSLSGAILGVVGIVTKGILTDEAREKYLKD